MSLDVLVAEVLALGPVEATAASVRSAESLALVPARAAERVPADPAANIDHGTVRAAARVLADRPADRFRSSAGAATSAMEKP